MKSITLKVEHLLALIGVSVLLFGSACGPNLPDMCDIDGVRVFNVDSSVDATQCNRIAAQVNKALLVYALREPELTNTDTPSISIYLLQPTGAGSDCSDKAGNAGYTTRFANGRGGGIDLYLGLNPTTGQECRVRESALAHEVLHCVDRNAIDRVGGHGSAPHDSLSWSDHGWLQMIEEARIQEDGQ